MQFSLSIQAQGGIRTPGVLRLIIRQAPYSFLQPLLKKKKSKNEVCVVRDWYCKSAFKGLATHFSLIYASFSIFVKRRLIQYWMAVRVTW